MMFLNDNIIPCSFMKLNLKLKETIKEFPVNYSEREDYQDE